MFTASLARCLLSMFLAPRRLVQNVQKEDSFYSTSCDLFRFCQSTEICVH